MLKSREFLREKSRGRAGGGTKLAPLAPVILGRDAQSVPRILLQRVSNLVNKFALLLHKYWLIEDSRNKSENDGCWRRGFSLVASKQRSVALGNKVMDTRLPQPVGCGDKYDVYDGCRGCGLSVCCNTFTIKAMSILAFLCLFSTAAEAKICFLPVDGCDTKIITKVKDDNASSCQYDSQYKAEQGIGACEIAYSPDKSQRKKKCWYRMCNTQNKNIFSTYEDCKNNLTGTQKCESCGSCYKRVAG